MIDIKLIQYKSIESNTHRRVNPTLLGLAIAVLKLEQFNAFKNNCYNEKINYSISFVGNSVKASFNKSLFFILNNWIASFQPLFKGSLSNFKLHNALNNLKSSLKTVADVRVSSCFSFFPNIGFVGSAIILCPVNIIYSSHILFIIIFIYYFIIPI